MVKLRIVKNMLKTVKYGFPVRLEKINNANYKGSKSQNKEKKQGDK